LLEEIEIAKRTRFHETSSKITKSENAEKKLKLEQAG
jgi:hypothetical protein